MKKPKHGTPGDPTKPPPKSASIHEYLAWLATLPTPPFKPHAWYNAEGDIVEVFLKSTEYYAEWINHQVTVLRDQKTNEIIGVQVWALEDDGKDALVSKVVRRDNAKRNRRVAAWRRSDAKKAAKK